LPTADAIYGCDDHWWDLYAAELKSKFRCDLWTQSAKSAKRYDLRHWEGESKPGLGKTKIHFGNNSGYQAINLAYLLGAKRIILLGYDMQTDGDQVHFFGNHPYHQRKGGPTNTLMKDWCEKFEALARDLKFEGVEVINATRKTALMAFDRQDLETIC
jgi:hypothetical protein